MMKLERKPGLRSQGDIGVGEDVGTGIEREDWRR